VVVFTEQGKVYELDIDTQGNAYNRSAMSFSSSCCSLGNYRVALLVVVVFTGSISILNMFGAVSVEASSAVQRQPLRISCEQQGPRLGGVVDMQTPVACCRDN
jgi:hypothetical protein